MNNKHEQKIRKAFESMVRGVTELNKASIFNYKQEPIEKHTKDAFLFLDKEMKPIFDVISDIEKEREKLDVVLSGLAERVKEDDSLHKWVESGGNNLVVSVQDLVRFINEIDAERKL